MSRLLNLAPLGKSAATKLAWMCKLRKTIVVIALQSVQPNENARPDNVRAQPVQLLAVTPALIPPAPPTTAAGVIPPAAKDKFATTATANSIARQNYPIARVLASIFKPALCIVVSAL